MRTISKVAAAADEIRTLLTGVRFGESPRWHEGRLWFCDWGAQEIVAVDLQGRRETIQRVGSMPFCIDPLPDGRMLIVNEGRVLRRERDGSLVTHAELSAASPGAWNEIVVDAHGNAYVNNINFDFPEGEFQPGFVALVRADGSVQQVADGLAFPNGMAITCDGSTLIVAESYGHKLTAFSIAPDGSLRSRRAWAEIAESAPDGICLDEDGSVWFADVPNKCCLRVREGGEIVRRIDLGIGCFSCALGGPDGRTLFMVAAPWPEVMSSDEPSGRILHTRA